MNATDISKLLPTLEAGFRHLTDASPDGVKYQNDAGWNARDLGIGLSLTHQIGRWSAGQIKTAWKVVQTYRRTQLSHLEIPPYQDDESGLRVIERVVAERDAVTITKVGATEGFGLKWGASKRIKLTSGWFDVISAQIPDGHAFWAYYRGNKEALKAQGYSLKQYNGWQLSKWTPAEAPAAATVVKVEPYAVRPVNSEGLLSYQVPSVERLVASLRAFRCGFDASDVGTGKTYVALAAFRELGITPTVVAPLSVLASWERAAAHFGIKVRVINWDRARTGKTEFGRWSGEDKKAFVWADDVQGLIFDEVHRAKSHSTQQHRLVAAAKRQDIPTLALSATAASNPLHLKALGYLLGLHQYKGFWAWTTNYGCYQNRWGGFEFDGNPTHLRKLNGEIFDKKGVRVRVEDLGDQFPETQISTQLVEVPNAAKIQAAYEDVAAAIEAVRAKQIVDPEHHLTKLLRARQLSELAKIPALIEQAEDGLEQGLSVAIFVNFNESLEQVVESLSKDHVVVQIHGQQSKEERDEAIAAFQSDKARVVVANIRAGGVGVSLHDLHGKHARLALISPSWSAQDFVQTLGRVRRAGGKTKSIQRVLFAKDTVEERVAQLLEGKCRNLSILNDGSVTDAEVRGF